MALGNASGGGGGDPAGVAVDVLSGLAVFKAAFLADKLVALVAPAVLVVVALRLPGCLLRCCWCWWG